MKSSVTKLKILHLEDSRQDAELISHCLKNAQMDCEIKVVENKIDFQNSLKYFDPDVILSDHSLPQFNSTEALLIAKIQKDDIPFILVTGTVSEEFAVSCIKNGADDYILKNNLARLPHAISHSIKTRQIEKEKRIADETLKIQYEKLLEVAFLQSHQVRAPISSILGLINLINFDNPNDPANTPVIRNLQKTTILFDDIIHEIVQKSSEVKAIL